MRDLSLTPEQREQMQLIARRLHGSAGLQLREGVIFEIARSAGLRFTVSDTKAQIRCPIHDDRNASAFLSAQNRFSCSVCTPGTSWTAKQFAQRLCVPWPPAGAFNDQRDKAPITPELAREVWRMALARASRDGGVDTDSAVYDYLAGRGLLESWELRGFGVLAADMDLPACIRWWPKESYRVVAPLYDRDSAELVGIQARAIEAREKRVLAPKGGRIAGTLFANAAGLEVLRGEHRGVRAVVLAEGLTDYLALSIVSPIPVLSGPGTGALVNSIGAWACGLDVYLAPDCDDAGDRAVQPAATRIYESGGSRVVRVRWPRSCKDAADALARLGEVCLGQWLRRLVERGPRGSDIAA